MKKLSIIKFKPKPEHFDEFVASLKHFISLPDRKGIANSFIMTKDEKKFSALLFDTRTSLKLTQNKV